MYAALARVGLPYAAALLLATIAGTVCNYFSLDRHVFGGRRSRETVLRFTVVYATIYAVNAAALYVLAEDLGVATYAAQVACIPLSMSIG